MWPLYGFVRNSNGFLDPQKLWIDTKIITVAYIKQYLCPIQRNGGHFGCHFGRHIWSMGHVTLLRFRTRFQWIFCPPKPMNRHQNYNYSVNKTILIPTSKEWWPFWMSFWAPCLIYGSCDPCLVSYMIPMDFLSPKTYE